MRHLATFIFLLSLGYDLSPTVTPVLIRELHDGNWLAGYAKPNLIHLKFSDEKILQAGLFHAWRSNKGDPSLGISLGVPLGDIGEGIGIVTDALEFPKVRKFFGPLKDAMSLDFYGGYRPVHGNDVHSWVYGLGITLNLRFGLPDLARGF